MSRIGRQPIKIPEGVDVKFDGQSVTIKGKKGELHRIIHPTVTAKVDDGMIKVTPVEEIKATRRYHGLTRSLLQNMVIGVSEGFTKTLALKGVGYRATPKGKGITLTIGYSHPVEFDPPEGIDLEVEKSQLEVHVKGPSKELVGQVAAVIRKFRAPEPYHGKGIRYKDEVIVTKQGKKSGK